MERIALPTVGFGDRRSSAELHPYVANSNTLPERAVWNSELLGHGEATGGLDHSLDLGVGRPLSLGLLGAPVALAGLGEPRDLGRALNAHRVFPASTPGWTSRVIREPGIGILHWAGSNVEVLGPSPADSSLSERVETKNASRWRGLIHLDQVDALRQRRVRGKEIRLSDVSLSRTTSVVVAARSFEEEAVIPQSGRLALDSKELPVHLHD